jgi:hypothetical protein
VTNGSLQSDLQTLHEHLAATSERPVERTASRWIGESEAIADDLVGRDADPDVVAERIGHVVDLLANVDTTEDAAADEHVDAARTVAAEILETVDESDG